jgi:hypothetical protein
MADATRVVERVQQVNTFVGGITNLSSANLYIGAATFQAQAETNAAITAALAQPAATAPEVGKSINPERDAAGRANAAAKAITSGPLSEELQKKLENGELIGSSAEFEAVMAELKRDNGVRAYYYDMFMMSRTNLEESLRIRSNDPFAHYYYGKVLKLTARNATEKQRALGEFIKAAELDKRRVISEPRLFRALALIDAKDSSRGEIVANLKDYVDIYQREHGGVLPPNMDVIYDYLQEAGETTWAVHPAMNVSTKNIAPLEIDRPVAPAAVPAPVVQPAAAPAVTPTVTPARNAPAPRPQAPAPAPAKK